MIVSVGYIWIQRKAETIDGIAEGMTMGEMVGIVRLGYHISYDPLNMLPTPDYVKEALKEYLS